MKKVELLFPELCNLNADNYNMEYLKRCSSEIELLTPGPKDTPAFVNENVDMIYLGSATEAMQEKTIELLMPHKKRIAELIDDGTIFFVTGNAPEIFGQYIEDDGKKIEALGVFDFYSVRYMKRERHNSQFIGTYDGLTLLGHKSQFSFAYGDFNEPFIHIEKGVGMNPDTKLEGINRNRFFATYSLGPFLILNPHFTKRILRMLGLDETLCFEDEIMEGYEYRLQELKKKKTL